MAFTRMRYHIVFATKNRQRWIDKKLEEFLYPVLCRQFKLRDSAVVTLGGVEDHVHIVAGIPPTLAVSNVLRDIKRDSAKAVRRNFRRLRSFKWQKSFGGFTANPNAMDELIDYVDNQKEHHQNNTLRREFEVLVDKLFDEEDEEEKEDNEEKDEEKDEDAKEAMRVRDAKGRVGEGHAGA